MAASIAEVKRWKPRHEIICIMHVAGRPNSEIAPQVGIEPERVSYIINSKRGQARVEALRKQILGGVAKTIEDQLSILGPTAVSNIARIRLVSSFSPESDTDGKIRLVAQAKAVFDSTETFKRGWRGHSKRVQKLLAFMIWRFKTRL